MHWADVEAGRLKERWTALGGDSGGGGDRFTIATGITPSGHIHVGNMREVLTGDAIYRACLDLGLPARLIYLGDDMDPLRKVYPFLDASYGEHIGKPLFEIPCPCGGHGSYSEHFLEPFIASLKRSGIDAEVMLVHEGYARGGYADAIRRIISKKDEVKGILSRVSGRDLPADWFPYTAKCSECGRFDQATATGFEDPYVSYTCKCGHEGKADINTAQGKLPWRLEWPARWQLLGVFCEPFGKDHAASGGSWDSGTRVMEEILGGVSPHPVVYEWIQLKGVGVMASSTGVVVTATDMLDMTPPEVLRYLVLRNNPTKHIDFDPGLGLLSLVDEYDRLERLYFGHGEGVDPEDQRRTYELAQVDRSAVPRLREEAGLNEGLESPGPGPEPLQVAYKHMVTLTQIAPGWDGVKGILLRNGQLTEEAMAGEGWPAVEAGLKSRLDSVTFWLERFAPDMVKFSVQDTLSEEAMGALDGEKKKRLGALRKAMEGIEWTPEAIHTCIHDTASAAGVKANKLFETLYRIFLGRKKGPRMGYFLASLERGFVLDRIAEGAGRTAA